MVCKKLSWMVLKAAQIPKDGKVSDSMQLPNTSSHQFNIGGNH